MYNAGNMLMKKIVRFFDKLEDKIRGRLSHHPIFYALVGGIGVVLFWRGVWHTADDVGLGSIASLVAGSVILLLIGVFVSAFVGNRLIISGLIGEKKLEEKVEEEIETEDNKLKNLQGALNRIEKKLEHIDEEVEKN
jgi:hypothetical protein